MCPREDIAAILGRIIEAVTGQTYEDHVKQMVARPLGIRTLQLGRRGGPQLAPQPQTIGH